MENEGAIIAVYNIKNLGAAIKKAKKTGPKSRRKRSSPVFEIVEKKLKEWSNS